MFKMETNHSAGTPYLRTVNMEEKYINQVKVFQPRTGVIDVLAMTVKSPAP
jgi:hypothetical protein